jgi:osmotically-inducible protein OsmY
VGQDQRSESVIGTIVMAVAAFTLGTAAGMVLGSAVGAVHGRRVRDTLGRIRRRRTKAPADLEQAVRDALREDEATSDLDIEVQMAEVGLVELTGVVSDAVVRRVAADVARAVPGVEVVVNRILLRDAGASARAKPDLRPI